MSSNLNITSTIPFEWGQFICNESEDPSLEICNDSILSYAKEQLIAAGQAIASNATLIGAGSSLAGLGTAAGLYYKGKTKEAAITAIASAAVLTLSAGYEGYKRYTA